MASSTSKTTCFLCEKIKVTYICQGCSNHFCIDHLLEHRTNIQHEFDQLQNNHDHLRQRINDLKSDSMKHSFIKQIDRWEIESIDKIKQHAQQCRTKFINFSNSLLQEKEQRLNDFAQQIKQIHQENEFNEFDLNDLNRKLEKLEKELNQPTHLCLKQQSATFVDEISLLLPSDLRWKQFATAIVGGHGKGNRFDQFDRPHGVSVDDQNQMIYVADCHNHRIVEWNFNTPHGRIVAGGNGKGNRSDQLNRPTDVVIDRQNNQLIIADKENRRVMKWSLQSNSTPQILIDNIDCSSLTMHEDGTLYVSDYKKDEVRRWKKGETRETIVAGGNGGGNQLNQLDCPTCLFVDDNHTLYISDSKNHRVMKWLKDSKEGIVVAGGNGRGDQWTQLDFPQGVIVDQFGQIYVADYDNDRVMRWREGETEGRIVVGGNGRGEEKNQLNQPTALSFDVEGNLYVADCWNYRIMKFERDSN